jgi:hypothetical protein
MQKSLQEQFQNSVNKNLKQLDLAVEKLLNQAGIKMVETVRDLQDKNKNYATRNLSNKTNYKIKNNVLTFGSNAASNGYNYGIVQEFGRKKGKFPNFGAIIEWVEKKVQLGHMTLDKKLGRTIQTRIHNLAYIIALSIKNKGIKGKFFYKQAFEAGNTLFLSKFNEVMTEVFK